MAGTLLHLDNQGIVIGTYAVRAIVEAVIQRVRKYGA